jgi:hypothetical protein
MDEQYDYVPPVHEVCAADKAFISCKRKYKIKSEDSKSVHTEEWLFDSGASVHVTPNKHLLLQYPNKSRQRTLCKCLFGRERAT